MGKVTRGRRVARISRSGLWLIGALLLLSVAVLAWALQNDMVPVASPMIHRPAPVNRPASRSRAARTQTRVEELAERPPSVSQYEPLLQGNVFQPRVITVHDRGAAKPSRSGRSAPVLPPVTRRKPVDPGSETSDAWNGWKFDGIAQMDQQTYALMEQPAQKQSHFVKAGDPVDDAKIISVADNEVDLRQADGTVIHLKRVDPMADMLRAARPTTPAQGQGAAPAPTVPNPTVPGVGPANPFPGGQTLPQGAPGAPAAGYDAIPGGNTRRGRRFQEQYGGGSAGQP